MKHTQEKEKERDTLQDGISVPHSSSYWLGKHLQDLLQIPGSVCCPFVHAVCAAVSFRRCRRRTCSSSVQRIPQASTISLRRAELWSQCGAPARPSAFWPGGPRALPHVRWSHWTGFLPQGVSPERSGFPLGELVWFPPHQCLNRWLVVARERDSVVPKLVDELRCSLCNPGELCSLSRNQHRPCHLVSPFTDDQHRSHLLFRFPLSKEPVLHRHMPLPNRLEHPNSCAASSHYVRSHRTCTMICTVDV